MEELVVKDPRQTDAGVEARRRFLKTMLVGGAAAAAVAAAGGAVAAPAEPEPAEAAPEKLGYRETQHIRDYYAHADF